jgi:uncharacterized protein YbaP (TraB family)
MNRRLSHSQALGTAALFAFAIAVAARAEETHTHASPAAVDYEPTAAPFLWQIEQDPPSYLYGTIHLPDPRVLALPNAVTEAFESSDVLYLEVPMDADAQQRAAASFLLPEGKSLRAILPEELYKRADTYCLSKGFPLGMLDRISVMGLVAQLQFLDYTDELLAGHLPLDLKLKTMADEDQMPVRSLETIDEQIGAFAAFTDGEQLSILTQTLDQIDECAAKGTSPTEDLVKAYLSGKESELLRLAEEYLDENDPATQKFMTNLVVDRNRRMAERIDDTLGQEPETSFFFAVGTLHYPDESGILSELTERGYTITRLEADDLDEVEPESAEVGSQE